MSVASEHIRPVRAGNDPTTATPGSGAAVIDIPTSAIVPASTIAPPSAIAPTANTTVPVSIEEHRAGVLRRRDEAECLGDDIAELSARIQAATYELLVMLRAFDEREGWSGFQSCAHWLNWRTGLALGAAREKVRVARALGDLPLLSDAMRRGQLSYSKVRALTRVATPANELRLLGFAECAPASYVERLARAWARVDRQAAAADERRRHERRNLNTWVDDDGMVVIRGRLSPEVGAVVRRALEAAADRLRTDVCAEEAAETSFGQRQADALGLLAESALSSDLDRGTAGDRYQVVLHVEPAALRADTGGRVVDASVTALPDYGAAGGDRATASSGSADVSAETPRTDTEDVSAETRPGAGTTPVPLRQAPRMAGHAALEDADGLRVSAETARRVACDAGAVVMRHAADGSVLDVGGRPAPSRRRSGGRCWRGTGSADFPAATRGAAMSITWSTGPTAVRPGSTTSCCSAAGTIGRSMKRASWSAWVRPTTPRSAGPTAGRCPPCRPRPVGAVRLWRPPTTTSPRTASRSDRTRRPRTGTANDSISATRSTCCGSRGPSPAPPPSLDAQRARLSIDVPRETRRRIRHAAARRDQSIRQYVSDAIEARLQDDLVDETSGDGFALKASADPVLAELWDNPADAAYDDL